MDNHYIALIPSYFLATVLWFIIRYTVKKPWHKESAISFHKPWLEFIYAIVAVLVILGLGQLYIRNMLIPGDNNYIDALNQFIIFSPTVILVIARKHSANSIWLPQSLIPLRILWGLAIAFISLFLYSLIRNDAAGFGSIITNIYHPKNVSHFVQVFMEDITIALLFVRLSAWIGRNRTIGIVAVLFAAGHIPAMVANGPSLNEFASLFLDATIGVLILSAISKSRDVWWFFMVHFALDMSQFYGGAG